MLTPKKEDGHIQRDLYAFKKLKSRRVLSPASLIQL